MRRGFSFLAPLLSFAYGLRVKPFYKYGLECHYVACEYLYSLDGNMEYIMEGYYYPN